MQAGFGTHVLKPSRVKKTMDGEGYEPFPTAFAEDALGGGALQPLSGPVGIYKIYIYSWFRQMCVNAFPGKGSARWKDDCVPFPKASAADVGEKSNREAVRGLG